MLTEKVYRIVFEKDIEKYDGETVTLNKLAAFQERRYPDHPALSIPEEIPLAPQLPDTFSDNTDTDKFMRQPPKKQRRVA